MESGNNIIYQIKSEDLHEFARELIRGITKETIIYMYEILQGDKKDGEQLMTINETAEFLRIHINTIYNWIKGGKLKSKRVGKRRLIAKKDLDKILNPYIR